MTAYSWIYSGSFTITGLRRDIQPRGAELRPGGVGVPGDMVGIEFPNGNRGVVDTSVAYLREPSLYRGTMLGGNGIQSSFFIERPRFDEAFARWRDATPNWENVVAPGAAHERSPVTTRLMTYSS